MRTIQINKIYCVQFPTHKKLVVCKRHDNAIPESSWADVETRDVDPKLEDEIFGIHTQLGIPHFDDPIVISDTQGHDYNVTYKHNQLSMRSLYEVFSKLLEKPMSIDEFKYKTKGKIKLT